MVGFGKQLKEKQLVEWQPYYISYKSMKKAFKQYGQRIQHGGEEKNRVHKDFSKMLDNEIEKIVLFLLEQQGALAERLSKLGEEREKCNSAPGQEPSFEKICQLRDGYRQVGQDLLRLNSYMETNATGIRKILKKFDKRFGSGFTDYYVRTRANHPYSQLQQVFKHVGIGAVAGAITRNLGELQECHGSYASIYDKPAMSLQDPIIDKIHAAVDKLTNSTSLLRFVAKRALITEEELAAPPEEQVEVDGRYDFMSLMLNLINTFLYMINTYIIVPTADDYSMSLGAAATVCGVVIGSMAIAQVFSSVYFSAWSNRSYFKPLIFSSIVLFLGNLMYAMAYDLSSIWLLLIGRLFCGLGSARAVNRRYISDCVPVRIRMQASAGFVSASALGMACGPALAAALQINFKIYGFTFNENTLPGWLMAVSWLLYLVLLGVCFKEPVRDNRELKPELAHGGGDALEKGVKQPLLLSNGSHHDGDDGNDEEKDGSEEAAEESRKPANSIGAAYRLLTPSTKAQLLVYFMLKYSMEVLLSESSVITTYYFSWSTNRVALFLGALGALVLPVNYVVGKYLSNMFQERQILLASEVIVFLGIISSFDYFFIKYSVPQYVISGVIMFVAAEVLEGVNLSLLSQVMSSRLARGTYNVGLLSTEAGTLARVVADGTITVVGYLVGESGLLNITLIPSLLICIGSLIATRCTYNSLY